MHNTSKSSMILKVCRETLNILIKLKPALSDKELLLSDNENPSLKRMKLFNTFMYHFC